jgi:hypothetical protein
MIEEEFKKLLSKEWEQQERGILEKVMDGIVYYRKLMPKALKNDVLIAIQMCNRLKDQLDTLLAEKQNKVQGETKETQTKEDQTEETQNETVENVHN